MSDDDEGGKEPSRFPHLRRNAAIILVAMVAVYSGYTIIGSVLTGGLPYPRTVALSGSANLPNIDLIPQEVYFTNSTGHAYSTPVSTSAHYSVILPNQATYNVSILYQNVVGGVRDICNAGIFGLASHMNTTTYNPTCSGA